MGKSFSPEDFQTRAEKVKKLEFPVNDESRVIVLPNNEGIGFRFNCYKQEFLGNLVDKQTFDTTVKKAQKICQGVWQLRKLQESSDYQEGSKVLLQGAFLLSLLSFILLIIVVYVTKNMILLYISIAMVALAGLITLFVAFKTLSTQPVFIDLEVEIIRKLSLFLDQENQMTYLRKGLRWEMEPKFYWLELHVTR